MLSLVCVCTCVIFLKSLENTGICREDNNKNNTLTGWYVSFLLYILFYVAEPAVAVIGLLLHSHSSLVQVFVNVLMLETRMANMTPGSHRWLQGV